MNFQRKTFFDQSGVTLLEVILTLLIISVLGSIALPQFSLLNDSFHRFNARALIVQDLKRAQAHALTEGCRGIIVIAPAKKSYSFGCDYLPYDPASSPTPDVVFFTRNLPPRISMSTSSIPIFNSRGLSVDVNDVLSNVIFEFYDHSTGNPELFAVGTMLGTGLFSFD